MNKNKGIIGLGLIVAIVLGIVVVGGGAYYLWKGSKINDKGNLDSKENLVQEVETNSINNNLSFYKNNNISFYYPNNWKIETLGTKNDKNIEIVIDPIKVFSPQEIKGLDVSMGMITFSVNNDSTEKNSFIIGYESFPTITIGTNDFKAKMFEKFYSNNAPEVSAQGEHHITYYIGENIKISYRSEKDIYLKDFNQLINSLDCNNYSDLNNYSEETFTVNSPTKNVSTELPAKYLDSQNWLPVVKTSSFAYSCKLSSGSGDVPTVVEEKTINGKKYCIKSLIDAGAGSRFGEYTYITPSTTGSGTKTASFNLRWSSCGGYDEPESSQCQATVSTFLNNLDAMVDSLM